MTISRWALVLCGAIAVAGIPVRARQQDQQQKPAAAAEQPVQLRVQVVISRYDGEKKISSLPYTLLVGTTGRSSLRMGVQVPIRQSQYQTGSGAPLPTPVVSYQYQNVGTSIDCAVKATGDGRYQLTVSVDDSSVYTPNQGASAAGSTASQSISTLPTLLSFNASEILLLRDGESTQYSSATDKITGQVLKIDVTLTVVK